MIEADGLPISAKVASIPPEPKLELRLESAANLFHGAISAVAEQKPDLASICRRSGRCDYCGVDRSILGHSDRSFLAAHHAADGHVDHLVRHATSKVDQLPLCFHARAPETAVGAGRSWNSDLQMAVQLLTSLCKSRTDR